MANYSINYGVVKGQVDEMEYLSTTSTSLQSGLEELKASITANWNGAGAESLLTDYDEFVANIMTITTNINTVKEWCDDTVASFKKITGENQDLINQAKSC